MILRQGPFGCFRDPRTFVCDAKPKTNKVDKLLQAQKP